MQKTENTAHHSAYDTSKKIFIFLAVATFFLVITAQTFWSTIHGDGAVYAWIMREFAEMGVFTSELPYWTQTQVFAEHPYLFFYWSFLFSKVFGFSDFAVKIPNYVMAGLSLFSLYKLSSLREKNGINSHQIGLFACYVLILNSAYVMQVSQPSLDPLAQLLSLLAAVLFIYRRKTFYSGVLLGLAFLTKGLEMLPNLAAIGLLLCFTERRNFSALAKTSGLFLAGLSAPLLIWFACDYFIWNAQWMTHYWDRQFTNRFFKKTNMTVIFDTGFLVTFLKIYWVEALIIFVGLLRSKKWLRRKDPLFIYFVCYVFFTILAFLLIKKDSSQHLTGVLLLGSIFVGEYLWEAWSVYRWKILNIVPILFFVLATAYWSTFFIKRNKNTDIWSAIKNEAQSTEFQKNAVPIVIKSDALDSYGFFYTAQWYFNSDKVYYQTEADEILVADQEVLYLDLGPTGELVKNRGPFRKYQCN